MAARGELRVLTWNVQLLWPQAGNPQQLLARARCIATKIKALQPQPDILCLQECWCPKSRALLRTALKSVYVHALNPEDAYVACTSPLQLRSAKCGLLLLSRHELKGTSFSRFTALGLESRAFDKGVCGCLVLLEPVLSHPPITSQPDSLVGADISLMPPTLSLPPPSSALIIVNTHLQSDFWGGEVGVRARSKQILELRAFAGRMASSANHLNIHILGCVICGDLNVAAGSPEAASLRALRAVDLLDALPNDASFPLGIWRPGGYKRCLPSSRLDYILDVSPMFRPDGARLVVKTANVVVAEDGSGLLSDHAFAEVSFAVPS